MGYRVVKARTATSAAGNRSKMMRRYRPCHGFTLFELLVVMVIMSLALAVAVPRIGKSLSRDDVQSASAQLASSMRLARNTAITRGRPVNFHVDVENRLYKSGSQGKKHRLPEHTRITLYTASSQLHDNGSGYIRFFPDGSASGGRVTLATTNATYLVDIDWLTGGITSRPNESLKDI